LLHTPATATIAESEITPPKIALFKNRYRCRLLEHQLCNYISRTHHLDPKCLAVKSEGGLFLEEGANNEVILVERAILVEKMQNQKLSTANRKLYFILIALLRVPLIRTSVSTREYNIIHS
jgi:hypothetical protein